MYTAKMRDNTVRRGPFIFILGVEDEVDPAEWSTKWLPFAKQRDPKISILRLHISITQSL